MRLHLKAVSDKNKMTMSKTYFGKAESQLVRGATITHQAHYLGCSSPNM